MMNECVLVKELVDAKGWYILKNSGVLQSFQKAERNVQKEKQRHREMPGWLTTL